jgi:hypothetical protein
MPAADPRLVSDRLCYPLHTFMIAVTQRDERIFQSGRNRQICRAVLHLAFSRRTRIALNVRGRAMAQRLSNPNASNSAIMTA